MKRKAAASRAAPPRPYRQHLSKVDFKRAIDAAREVNLPVSRVDVVAATGDFSLIIGTNKPDDSPTINEQQLKDLI